MKNMLLICVIFQSEPKSEIRFFLTAISFLTSRYYYEVTAPTLVHHIEQEHGGGGGGVST